MREAGLQQAIGAAGGVGELARRLGIAPPSVSAWQRVPAERVAAVEAATGVARDVLRPDLFAAVEPADPIEAARANLYRLLAGLLLAAPDAPVLARLAALPAGEGPVGEAVSALARAARTADPPTVAREHFRLFVGVGRGEVLPYASWYLTGFLHDRPLARVRAALAERGIESAEGVPEPEDHLGRLCEVMAGLIAGPFAATVAVQRHFFTQHMQAWAGRCFADIGRAAEEDVYRAVAGVGSAFVAVETEAFTLPD
jgi:TorA maturation chaperone TorD